jgi:hypothetical protein
MRTEKGQRASELCVLEWAVSEAKREPRHALPALEGLLATARERDAAPAGGPRKWGAFRHLRGISIHILVFVLIEVARIA